VDQGTTYICSVRSEEVVEFFTDIIYRFRIPNAIITDNGSNFTDKKSSASTMTAVSG
jgi:hypothetical protein